MQGKTVSIRRDRGGRPYHSIGRCSTKILRLKGSICTGETGDELICCKNGTESITAALCDVQIAVHRRLLIPHAHPNKRAGMTSISSRSRREWVITASHGSQRMLYSVHRHSVPTQLLVKTRRALPGLLHPAAKSCGNVGRIGTGWESLAPFCPDGVIFPVAATLQGPPQNLG